MRTRPLQKGRNLALHEATFGAKVADSTMAHVFILGPTASGKSSLALALARRCGGVVCNLDAFQVYRGLDIGTGKPSAPERGAVPHALYDLVGPCEAFSVADYLRAASRAVDAHPGKPLIWTGGTGLYFRALRSGLAPAPASDPAVVRELEAMPAEARVEEIRRVDPDWAAGADLRNPRRVLRALAVFRQTGRPLSSWHRDPVRPLLQEGHALLLEWDAEALRRRITARVDAMWAAGWPDEVAALAADPAWEHAPSARAIGYAEVLRWVREGGDAAAVRQAIALRTWHYARRQLTWFRSERNLHPIPIDERFDADAAARDLVEASLACGTCSPQGPGHDSPRPA